MAGPAWGWPLPAASSSRTMAQISVSNVEGGCRFEVSLPVPGRSSHVRVRSWSPAGLVSSAGQFMINSQRPAGGRVSSTEYSLTDGTTLSIMIGSPRRHPAATPSSIWPPRSALVSASGDIDEYALHNDYGTAMALRVAADEDHRASYTPPRWSSTARAATAALHHGSVRPPARRPDDLDGWPLRPAMPLCGDDLIPELVPESAPLDPRNSYAATKGPASSSRASGAETGGAVAALGSTTSTGPGIAARYPVRRSGDRSSHRQPAARRFPRVFEDGRQRRNFIHVSRRGRRQCSRSSCPYYRQR